MLGRSAGLMRLKKRLFATAGVVVLAAGITFTKAGDQSPLPVYAGKEQESDLYVRPEPASIEGYDGSAMEPFISPDGQFLYVLPQESGHTLRDLPGRAHCKIAPPRLTLFFTSTP
jgi:hypothetical protein